MTETKSSSFTIKHWKPIDRPREKLIQNGKHSLSDAELLSILIGSGNRSESAVDLARRILGAYDNSLNRIARAPVKELMRFEGIGNVKALIIVTALELGRRRSGETQVRKPKIVSSQSVFDLMQPLIGELNHEEFWILYLNGANRVEARIQLSKGGMTATLVDVRLIFKLAVEHGATSVILCHNHPSGNLTPSSSDKSLTRKIIQGGKLLDIKVIDHVIVTEEGHFSFVDEDLM
jgi:DNA repair protein RadC